MQPLICCVILHNSDAKLMLSPPNGQTVRRLFPEKDLFYRDKSRNHSFSDFPFWGWGVLFQHRDTEPQRLRQSVQPFGTKGAILSHKKCSLLALMVQPIGTIAH